MLAIRNKKIVKTRKVQQCFACEKEVAKGESVIYVSTKEDNRHFNFHLHFDCNKIISRQQLVLEAGCLKEGVPLINTMPTEPMF